MFLFSSIFNSIVLVCLLFRLFVCLFFVYVKRLLALIKFDATISECWMLFSLCFLYLMRVVLTIFFLIGLNGYRAIEKSEYLIYLKKCKQIEFASRNCSDLDTSEESFETAMIKNATNKRKQEFKFGLVLIPLFIGLLIIYMYSIMISCNWNCDLITLNMVYKNHNKHGNERVINWSIFGGEPPLFSVAFHFGWFLSMVSVDCLFTKSWFPAYDLSYSFFGVFVVLGIWQIINLIVYYQFNLVLLLSSQPQTVFLACVIAVSIKFLTVLWNMDNLFSGNSGFFVNS